MDLFLSADEYIPMDSQCRDLALQSDYLTAGDIGYVLRTEAIKRILSGSFGYVLRTEAIKRILSGSFWPILLKNSDLFCIDEIIRGC
jgi:hypothetical protein